MRNALEEKSHSKLINQISNLNNQILKKNVFCFFQNLKKKRKGRNRNYKR